MAHPLAVRNKIDRLHAAMENHPATVPADSIKVNQYLTDNGLYAREMILPAGSLIVGKIKKDEYITIVSAGFATEITEAGKKTIKAPYTMVCAPGTKRVLYAHETTVWTTIHRTSETDIDKVADTLTVEDHKEYQSLLEELQCHS